MSFEFFDRPFKIRVLDAAHLIGYRCGNLLTINSGTVAVVRAGVLDDIGVRKHRLDVTAAPAAHQEGRAARVPLVDDAQCVF